MSSERMVVVGVDGSAESLAAVRWAAADAANRRCSLHVVYAYIWPVLYGPAVAVAPYESGAQEAAVRMLAEAAAHARSCAPGLEVSTEQQVLQPAAALVAASRHACTVVVGNRGRGGFAGLLLGSVGVQLAAHAACPVVIVRHADRPAGTEAGRIVVGIDGSQDAGRALQFAFEQASTRAAGLTAVLAYQWPAPITHGHLLPLAYDPEELREDQQRTLAEAMAGWAEKYPDVDVRRTAVSDQPATVLTELSAGAELLVVGSRGRGGFTGLLLGSVSHAVIHHAACPVAVVR